MIEIIDKARTEGAKRFQKLDLLEWAQAHIRLKKDGYLMPFSLDGYEELYELYTMPDVPKESHQKAAQKGVSIYELIRTLWRLDRLAMKAVYYFPTDEDVKDFCQDRANPLIDDSEYLSGKMRYDKADNLGLKQIGQSSLYFRGVWSKRKVKTVDADIVIKDELDEADQENMVFAEDRLLNSVFKFIGELSQPSRPDFGINKSFKLSDMRYLLIKCSKCGRWNNVVESFPKNLFSKGKGDNFFAWIGCIRCRAKLDYRKSEWVPKHPSRSKYHRGYQHSQLYGSRNDGNAIYKKYTGSVLYSEKKNFWISWVGVPFRDSELCPFTDRLIEENQGQYGFAREAQSSFMGIDVGDVCHGVILGWTGRRLRILNLFEILADDEAGFHHWIEKFRSFFVIDAMPYKSLSKRLCLRYNGWGAIQYFKGDALKEKAEGEGEFEVRAITHDRTESIDEMAGLAGDGFFEFPDPRLLKPDELALFEKFKEQLKNLEKEKVMDKNGYEKAVYKKNLPNHFGMAMNSALIAFRVGKGQYAPQVDPMFG